MPPALAVRVTVCAALTAEAVAGKLALVALLVTVTVDGTVTAGLLLDKLTTNPPLAAAALNVTTQLTLPAPVTNPLEQLSPLSTGRAGGF
jgi:predicted permease